MKRLTIIAVAVVALAAGILDTRPTVHAQPAGKVFRVGYLSLASRASIGIPIHEAFLHKLRELGYVEGRNLVFEGRWAGGDPGKLPRLAAELVRAGVDVVLTFTSPPTRAAMQVTTTIPIVFISVHSPVERGFVASLARPGGNVTGLSSDVGPAIQGKRLELLKEAVPRMARVAYLVDTNIEAPGSWKALQDAARVLSVVAVRFETAVASDFDSAFGAIARLRPDALLIYSGPFHDVHRARIIEFASRSRLPAMYTLQPAVRDGGLMTYGHSSHALAARAAVYVDKILRGAWPGDLPVERPTKFELIINLKTARVLGLTIPQSLLQRADEVIR